MTKLNDPHFHRVEEARHARHAEIRKQVRAGDGTLTLETEAAMLSEIRHRRNVAALKAHNDDLQRQLDEALAGGNQDTEEAARWLIRNPAYQVQS